MLFLIYVLSTVLIMVSLFMVLLVLIQRGRGGGLAGAFGGMGGQSAFGTRAGDMFTRITVVLAVVWVLLAGGIGMMMRRETEARKAGVNSPFVPGAKSAATEDTKDGSGADEADAAASGNDQKKATEETAAPTGETKSTDGTIPAGTDAATPPTGDAKAADDTSSDQPADAAAPVILPESGATPGAPAAEGTAPAATPEVPATGDAPATGETSDVPAAAGTPPAGTNP